jgi:hypothetical protein
MLGRS